MHSIVTTARVAAVPATIGRENSAPPVKTCQKPEITAPSEAAAPQIKRGFMQGSGVAALPVWVSFGRYDSSTRKVPKAITAPARLRRKGHK